MRLKLPQILVALLIVGALILGGCSTQLVASQGSSPSLEATNSSLKTDAEATPVSENTDNESFSGMKDLPRLEGNATVVITVNGAPITIEVDGNNAPITAGNFVDLVEKKVYDGLVFHRVVRDPQPFVVQGGDPLSKNKALQDRWGTGGYIDPKTQKERYIPLEIKPVGADKPVYHQTITGKPVLTHKQGAIAMARSQTPDSASSQFYFALAKLDFLDGDYAVFGYVTDGFDVVNKIKQGDQIESAKVIKGAENLKTQA